MRITEKQSVSHFTALWKNIIQPLILLAVILLVFTLFFPLYGQVSVDGEAFEFICLPNGDALTPRVLRYQLLGETRAYYMNWSTRQFLSPTMSWGHLSFATAKAIDIAWDLLVGRVGQFAVAYYTYPVLKRILLYRLESSNIPLSVYSSLAIDRISPWFLLTLVMPRHRGRSAVYPNAHSQGLKSSTIGIWTLLSLVYIGCYILLFQTILSIATSYQARLAPAIADVTNDVGLTDASYLRIPGLILRDGSRVGLADDMPLCFSYSDAESLCELFYDYASASAALPGNTKPVESVEESVMARGGTASSQWTLWASNAGEYHSNFTINGRFYQLQPPVLNIEAISSGEGPDTKLIRTAEESWDEMEKTLPWYTIHGALLSFSQVENLARCLPSAHYEWGFSFLMLFTFFFLTVIFLAILAGLRYKLHWHSRTDVLRPEMSTYRDILDMAHELRTNLGEETDGMTCAEIRHRTATSDVAVSLDTSDLPLSRRQQKMRRHRASSAVGLDPDHDGISMSSLVKETVSVHARDASLSGPSRHKFARS